MRGLLRTFGSLLVLGGILALVFRERSTFDDAFRQISHAEASKLVAGLLLVAVGRGVIALAAWATIASRLSGVGARASVAAWLRAAVAKYVPGIVWHPVASVERLQRAGASVGGASLVFLVDTAAMLLAALVVGAGALPEFLGSRGWVNLWLLLALPVVLSLHPRVFAAGLRVLARVTGRDVPQTSIAWPFVVRIVAIHVAGWLVAGAGLAYVVASLRVDAPAALVVSSAALSWAVGFLVVPAPAGIGVREATLVLLLSGAVGTDVAIGVALAWRAVWVAFDVGCLGVSAFVRAPA